MCPTQLTSEIKDRLLTHKCLLRSFSSIISHEPVLEIPIRFRSCRPYWQNVTKHVLLITVCCSLFCFNISQNYTSHERRKTVFKNKSDSKTQLRLLSYIKYLDPWNYEWSKTLCYYSQASINNGADQSVRMRSLICTFVNRTGRAILLTSPNLVQCEIHPYADDNQQTIL